jgi:transcriptional regulator with XRE-family HTH domain
MTWRQTQMAKHPLGAAFNPYALWVVMARRGVTAPELAKKLGKRTSKINRFLLGINEPSDSELQTISRVLDWPIGFFTNTNVKPPDWISI